ncbi:MAG: UDP-3-O-[3-hydroxymyristoyl] N-acetylglucosamine deacetylase [Candidatus Hydrogenedentes bacterium]|nr:UDP-3-O-[3-hydroxymyristoyl] N-acetylglucosamine deacetylase [Candidatus Hydrogenedentota bacterium]
MSKQKTISKPVSFSGIGLHTGSLTTVTFKPAPENSGITFFRVDIKDSPPIPANIDYVVDVSRGTTIGIGEAKVHTVEHALAAMVGLGIDNLNIELDAEEIPNGDGSSLPVMSTLQKAGIVEQDAEKQYIQVDRPVYYRQGDVTLSILPSDELRVSMTIAYDHVAIGTQYASYTITEDTFAREIAPARTFCFLREVKMLQEKGLIRGGSLESAVVIGDDTILNDELRFPDEFVRHKILDLIGDMYLLGRPVKGHVVGVKGGHEKNVLFSKQIRDTMANGNGKRHVDRRTLPTLNTPPALDVNKIMKILPHRYPFLLVDRILSFVPMERVTGIKNVSVNEPFFQGHWPETPVMPGVMIIEAMAQVSAVLIFGDNRDPDGKLAFFLGVDKARFRRTVVPGDQLVIECEMVRRRKNACKVAAKALVDGVVVAEAVMTFGLMTPDSRLAE